MSIYISLRRTALTFKMNFKYLLLLHCNEMTQLISFLRLFGKQNQNILVVNYYKMKTAFVSGGAHSVWSWIVMCLGKMTQHGMNPNSFSPETLWGENLFSMHCWGFTAPCLARWNVWRRLQPLEAAQPLSLLGCGRSYPGELPVWSAGIAGWVQPRRGGMWGSQECVPLALCPTSSHDNNYVPGWAGNVPTDSYKN